VSNQQSCDEIICHVVYSIALKATPASGYAVDRWDGCGGGTSGDWCFAYSDGPDQTVTAHFRKAECSDGSDNDGDDTVDHPNAKVGSDPPADPDCESPSDDSEAYTPPPDTTPPPLTVTPDSIGPTNDPTPTVQFSSTEPDVTYTCWVLNDSDASTRLSYVEDNCISPYTTPSLTDGPWRILVVAKDAAGNESKEYRPLTVDTTAPDTSITSAPSPTALSTSASFHFSSSQTDSRFECSLDGGPWSACTSPKGYSSLSQGRHNFKVAATDPGGNRDSTPATHTWTIDSIRPTVTRVSPSPGAGRLAQGERPRHLLGGHAFEHHRRAPDTTRAQGNDDACSRHRHLRLRLKRAKLDPSSPLKRGTTYVVTVTTRVRDLAGNPMLRNKSWSFTVRR
jgi:Bacterial Ig-like domain